MLVHTVYFYLKPNSSADEKTAFKKAVEGLGAVETVRAIYVGSPAATPDRPVIQKDYDVGLTVLFDSLEDHDIYQVHALHNDFIDKNKHLWEKVVIYDAN